MQSISLTINSLPKRLTLYILATQKVQKLPEKKLEETTEDTLPYPPTSKNKRKKGCSFDM